MLYNCFDKRRILSLFTLFFMYGSLKGHCAEVMTTLHFREDSISLDKDGGNSYEFTLDTSDHFSSVKNPFSKSDVFHKNGSLEAWDTYHKVINNPLLPKCSITLMNGWKLSFDKQTALGQTVKMNLDLGSVPTNFQNAAKVQLKITSTGDGTKSEIDYKGTLYVAPINFNPTKFYFDQTDYNFTHAQTEGTIVTYEHEEIQYWLRFNKNNRITVFSAIKALKIGASSSIGGKLLDNKMGLYGGASCVLVIVAVAIYFAMKKHSATKSPKKAKAQSAASAKKSKLPSAKGKGKKSPKKLPSKSTRTSKIVKRKI